MMTAVGYREVTTGLNSDELCYERGSVRESSLADALVPASRDPWVGTTAGIHESALWIEKLALAFMLCLVATAYSLSLFSGIASWWQLRGILFEF